MSWADAAPSTGPVTSPSPNAAPTIPIARDRSWRVVTSATAAVATERLPLKAPLTMRDTTNSQNEPLTNHTRYPAAVPATVMRSTPRRPLLSDRAPQNGAKTNWRIA